MDLRVYVTDRRGIVVYDSQGRDTGKNYSNWRDVRLTLEGAYGARTTRDDPNDPRTTVFYVAGPIVVDGEIEGVLTLGKPAVHANIFAEEARSRFLLGTLLTALVTIVLVSLVGSWFTTPLMKLRVYANSVRDGVRATPPRARGEIGEVVKAFEEMREALEGKQYVERYLQTLTHELKSPITAIRASAELLDENPEPASKERFVKHIRAETERMETLVDGLLALSALERQETQVKLEQVNLATLVDEAVLQLKEEATKRQVTVVGTCRRSRFRRSHVC